MSSRCTGFLRRRRTAFYFLVFLIAIVPSFFLALLCEWGLLMSALPHQEIDHIQHLRPVLAQQERFQKQGDYYHKSSTNEQPLKSINNNNNRKGISFQFYRWGTSDDGGSGIPMEPIRRYISHLLSPHGHSEYGFTYGPVVAYIDANANLLCDWTIFARRQGNVRDRLQTIGPFWYQTLQHYKDEILSSQNSKFPYLTRALQDGGRLPLIFQVMDYTGCPYHNFNYTTSGGRIMRATVPMFTLSSSPDCNYAFPIPSYTTISLATEYSQTNNDWDTAFHQNDNKYPWHTQQRKAVWRGAPNGMAKWKTSILQIPRVSLNFLAQNHTDIMDVAVPCHDTCLKRRPLQPWIILGNYMPMEEFQRYRAVLDLDGNSWSERFPRLLCQNSVVIKVEPEQIDYFWPTLQAGVHYVAANFGNLVSVVQYVISDAHQEEMQRIVANAHAWCQQRMVVRQIQLDILTLLDGYARELYRADPHWHRYLPPSGNLSIGIPFQ